mmetsp:Transcript_77452/g.241348  ORF Transcript_77452/g.241348 Transcript_77452/m.241348 type:complete len:264 (-) Transcript_77452:137-928(-)
MLRAVMLDEDRREQRLASEVGVADDPRVRGEHPLPPRRCARARRTGGPGGDELGDGRPGHPHARPDHLHGDLRPAQAQAGQVHLRYVAVAQDGQLPQGLAAPRSQAELPREHRLVEPRVASAPVTPLLRATAEALQPRERRCEDALSEDRLRQAIDAGLPCEGLQGQDQDARIQVLQAAGSSVEPRSQRVPSQLQGKAACWPHSPTTLAALQCSMAGHGIGHDAVNVHAFEQAEHLRPAARPLAGGDRGATLPQVQAETTAAH